LYRQEGQVKLLRISLASLAACAALAAPAHANNGNGLYEPFPSPTSESLAQGFVDALPGGLAFTAPDGLDLGRGVLVGNGAKAAYAGSTATPSRSASGAGFAPSFGWPLGLVLLAAVVGGAGVLAARRRA
jgi:hypothetical protein